MLAYSFFFSRSKSENPAASTGIGSISGPKAVEVSFVIQVSAIVPPVRARDLASKMAEIVVLAFSIYI